MLAGVVHEVLEGGCFNTFFNTSQHFLLLFSVLQKITTFFLLNQFVRSTITVKIHWYRCSVFRMEKLEKTKIEN